MDYGDRETYKALTRTVSSLEKRLRKQSKTIKSLIGKLTKAETVIDKLDRENGLRRPLNAIPPNYKRISEQPSSLGQQISDIESGKVVER